MARLPPALHPAVPAAATCDRLTQISQPALPPERPAAADHTQIARCRSPRVPGNSRAQASTSTAARRLLDRAMLRACFQKLYPRQIEIRKPELGTARKIMPTTATYKLQYTLFCLAPPRGAHWVTPVTNRVHLFRKAVRSSALDPPTPLVNSPKRRWSSSPASGGTSSTTRAPLPSPIKRCAARR